MQAWMRRLLTSLYGQVLIGLCAGTLVGHYAPRFAHELRPLGDVFIQAIRMVIGPVVLCTVVAGVARAGNARTVGRLGGKAILYFEAVTTVALAIGLLVANVFRPGANVNASLESLDASALARTAPAAEPRSMLEFLTGLAPGNIVEALARGELLHILVFAILMGLALCRMGERARRLTDALADLGECLLHIVGFVMKLAPIAAFGAMAFTIGAYGVDALIPLMKLVACLYLTCLFFLLLVLAPVLRCATGLSLWALLKYIRAEILITVGTASSEAVLPRMMEKLERLGCEKSAVGLILPTGYSFNLDGTSIYLTMACVFIAQALDIGLSWRDQIELFAILLITSKGIAGVSGAALVVLVATLSATDILPVAGVALILGIDRIQSEARSVVNVIGNAVATVVLSHSEKKLDIARARETLGLASRASPALRKA